MAELEDVDIDVSKDEFVQCPQLDTTTWAVIGVEDCLRLNIYKPNILGAKPANLSVPMPVMVWIYGGSFYAGSNRIDQYGPDYFMDKGNVIVVSINYRLGPLGFLTLKSEGITGKFQIIVAKY